MSANHPTKLADLVKTAGPASSAESALHPTTPGKPSKPYPEFPLFAHAAGVWAKKIRGKLHYFGPWSDPDGVLTKHVAGKDTLQARRKPRLDTAAVTVKDVAISFLNAKQARVNAGELSARTWADNKRVCDLVVSHLGKARLAQDAGPDDSTPRAHLSDEPKRAPLPVATEFFLPEQNSSCYPRNDPQRSYL